MLPANERAFYSANNGQEWRDLVHTTLIAANTPALNPAVDTNMTSTLFGFSIRKDGATLAHVIQINLTKDSWVRGMSQGVDKFTAAKNFWMTKHTDGTHPLKEFGSLKKRVDDVNNGANRGGIFEFRDIKTMTRQNWRQFALDVFDYATLLNSGAAGATYAKGARV